MANYFNDGISDVPFTADEDLTGYQWKLVVAASTSGNVQAYDFSEVSPGSPLPIGVLTNDPSAGQEASVRALGFTKVKARVSVCDLQHGVFLMAASDGMLEPACAISACVHAIGRWFGPRSTTAAASILGNALILIHTPCPGGIGSVA